MGNAGSKGDGNLTPFPEAGRELAELIRDHDWTGTPLGPIPSWPQILRRSVNRILREESPFFICWGPSFISLYNDAFAHFLGSMHPESLGEPYTRVSAAFWLEERPLIGAVMAGQAQHIENMIVHTPARPGRLSGRFTFTLTPVKDEAGIVGGFVAKVIETTNHSSGGAALDAAPAPEPKLILKGDAPETST